MKKFVRLFLVLSLLIAAALPFQRAEASTTFKDVNLYKKEILFLANKSIIKGYKDGTFKPEASIKRLQAVQMLLRAKGIKDFNAKDPGFADVKKGDYGYEEIAKSVELGIISGKTDPHTGKKYFNPWDTLTRGQMAKILSLSYNIKGSTLSEFSDVPNSNDFYTYINALAYNNITTGYADNTFKPYQSLSRQHFSVFLARTLQPSFKDNGANRFVTAGLKLNPRKTFVYKYPSDNYTETWRYGGKDEFGEKWTASGSEGKEYYSYRENNKGLDFGIQNSEILLTIPYPLKQNTKWTYQLYEGDPVTNYVVTSMNKTITTPAATFKNTIEIKDYDGIYYYYVQGLGLVLVVDASHQPSERIFELQKVY
ncbi:S-layer homology domain-containing protein [Priestia filamentosa]|uniref:Uncharacterized protein n=1 Tax=Priestia filamentosa TaxID=1402861 RepID=A0A1X7EN33_9BACI|nr:S-layer homology domain-containing protein [Priestia filamentosa]AWG44200.1 hypothetical protein BEH_24345 [Priestia filamentosa]MDT3763306.1 S-layer homology domain-containing protein [Priestia filamentosa]OXS69809.1 hypothetical protein B1B01_12715 [Priestia filamentosa]SMF36438.1 S-layer homology domain-containing protein [Priestia filamentosa]